MGERYGRNELPDLRKQGQPPSPAGQVAAIVNGQEAGAETRVARIVRQSRENPFEDKNAGNVRWQKFVADMNA